MTGRPSRAKTAEAVARIRALFQPWPDGESGPTDEPDSQYRFGYNTAIEDALDAIAISPSSPVSSNERTEVDLIDLLNAMDDAGFTQSQRNSDSMRKKAHALLVRGAMLQREGLTEFERIVLTALTWMLPCKDNYSEQQRVNTVRERIIALLAARTGEGA